MRACQYVFAYGSLAAEGRGEGFAAELSGYARGWGVAMDNRRDLPGYKWYADEAGDRPAVHVCFLDVAERADASVNGLCLPVGDDALPALDARERNYRRVDVSARVAAPAGARVWTYVGSPEGRARLRQGVIAGTAVIAAAYLEAVRVGFASLGPQATAAAAASLQPGALPVRALIRHDLP